MAEAAATTKPPPRPRRWARRFGCLLPVGLLAVLLTNEWLVRRLLNPLRQSPAAIERGLLERTPLGTPRPEVKAWLDAQCLGYGGRPYPLGTEWPVQRVLAERWNHARLHVAGRTHFQRNLTIDDVGLQRGILV